jgi:hypothetical protein
LFYAALAFFPVLCYTSLRTEQKQQVRSAAGALPRQER